MKEATGIGHGIVVVRKWTDRDYARLIEQEQSENGRGRYGESAHQRAMRKLASFGIKPYGVAVGRNAFMRATGNKHLWERLTGIAAPTLFDNTNAKLGVGDSSTAVTVTQTNLQAATNKLRKAMVATYPLINGSPNDNQVVFRSDFITGEAEFTWNEFGTFNNVTDGVGSMFNRGLFSPSPGTKGAGVTWTLTETLTNT